MINPNDPMGDLRPVEWHRTVRAWEENGRWYEESTEWYPAPRRVPVSWTEIILLAFLTIVVASMIVADLLKGYRL